MSITIEEYERLTHAAVRNRELIDGRLVDDSDRAAVHNRLRDSLLVLLARLVKNGDLIICMQCFDFDGDAFGPDVSLI
jgi:hypothetical protein